MSIDYSTLVASNDVQTHKALGYVQVSGLLASELSTLANIGDGDSIRLDGVNTVNDGGEGAWYYNATQDKATANLGTIIDTSVALTEAGQGTGAGTGCWMRNYKSTDPISTLWFGDTTDIGDRINTIIDLASIGAEIKVAAEHWHGQSYATTILINKTCTLLFPGAGNGARAHYTGADCAIDLVSYDSHIKGGLALDFDGNVNPGVDGIHVRRSDCVVSDDVEINGAPRYGVLLGDTSAAVYGNNFTGELRITAAGEEGVRISDLGGISVNRNQISNLVIAGASTPFIAQSTTLTQTGSLVTATSAGHGYTVGDVVTIAGAVEGEYNGVFIVTSVPTVNTFTYKIETDPTSPATGVITAKRNNVSMNFVKGYGNAIIGMYDQNGAVDAWSIAALDANPNTIINLFIDSAIDNSIIADAGCICAYGGENNSSDIRQINTGSITMTKGKFERPNKLNPQRIILQNIQSEYQGGASPNIYGTLDSGGGFPFSFAGNLVLEGRADNSAGISFSTGAIPTERFRITGAGLPIFQADKIRIDPIDGSNECDISVGAGSPEGSVIGDIGYVYINTHTPNSGMYIKMSGTGTNTGWLLVQTV